METLLVITLFAFGTILASFLGVVVARLNTGQSFFSGRSKCDACGQVLAPVSLIPVLSYLMTRGRAHCCGARISALAPLSELLLGTLFVLSYKMLGISVAFVFFVSSLALLLALVLYDLAHQILPPSLLYPFVILSAATAASASSTHTWQSTLATATLIGGSLAAIHVLSRGRAMGLADAPLAFGLALLVGQAALTGFVFSFWIGAAVGIVLLARRPAGSRIGVEVPFAPFLACGFLLAYFTQWNLFTYLTALPR